MYVDSNGKLGYAISSGRYKHEINPIDTELDKLLELNPVSFKYLTTRDPQQETQYGLIAEEVAKILPELVVTNSDGSPETVRYQFLAPLLLKGYQAHDAEIANLINRLVEVEAELALLKAKNWDR